jgi:hypothetical protein
MIVLTVGLWLLVIPLYPARCINCGLTRGSALLTNLGPRSKFAFLGLGLLVVLLLAALWSHNSGGNKTTSSQPENSQAASPAESSTPVQEAQDEHELRLVPNIFSGSAVADGRNYSVSMIYRYLGHIPPRTTGIEVQGIFLQVEAPFTISIADEQERSEVLLCTMSEDEFQDAQYYYHPGEAVTVMGTYSTATGIPQLRDCTMATGRGSVVRPLALKSTGAQSPVPEPEDGKTTGLSRAALQNMTYVIGVGNTAQTVTLVDGEGRTNTDQYSLDKDSITFGELDPDGAEDAVVVISDSGGGSGTFEALVAVRYQNGKAVSSAQQELGDRIKVNSITINHRIVTVDMLVQGPNDGLCCPTKQKVIHLMLQGDHFVDASTVPAPVLSTVTPVASAQPATYPSGIQDRSAGENPKGQTSGEVLIGQTPDEVIAILGPPSSITTGAQRIYTYPKVQISFIDGKVARVQKY